MTPHRSPNRFTIGDLIAGISVALVLIPQSLAYAEIAGLPIYIGLYAGALPPIAMSFFTSSRYLQTGPAATTSLLTFGVLTGLAAAGTTEYVKLASLLAVMVGVTRLLLGLIRAGKIVYLMTAPVLLGFTTAAGILIISSQIPRVLGTTPPAGTLLAKAGWAVLHPGAWHWIAIAVGLATALMVLGGRRISSLFPGLLVAVIAAIAFSVMFDYSGGVVGEIPTGFPPVSLDLPFHNLTSLLIGAVVIALAGFAEPAAIARTFAGEDDEHWDASKELRASGVANLVSGVSGAYPVGGSFSRSSVNRLAGAHTRWAGAITGLTVVAFLPFAAVLSPLPQSVLSATIIVAVYRLVDFKTLARLIRMEPLNGIVALTTFAATLLVSPRLERGILIGVAAGGVATLWQRRTTSKVDARSDQKQFIDD